MLDRYLEQLDFNENEIKLYLQLIELGVATANQLGRSTEIPRTTAYSVLDNLVDRGLVTTDRERGVTFYTASNPTALTREVEREKGDLAKKEQLAHELVELIQPFFRSKNLNVPKIRFYDGSKNVENMLYDNYPAWEQSMMLNDGAMWGYQDHTFVEQHLPWLKWQWQRKDDWRIQLFSNESKVEKELKGKVVQREIRPFPLEFQFDSSIWICGDYVIMIVTRQQPHYAFELKDARFAGSLKLIFRLLWGLKALR